MSLELRSRNIPLLDNKSLGYCCGNCRPTEINPLTKAEIFMKPYLTGKCPHVIHECKAQIPSWHTYSQRQVIPTDSQMDWLCLCFHTSKKCEIFHHTGHILVKGSSFGGQLWGSDCMETCKKTMKHGHEYSYPVPHKDHRCNLLLCQLTVG